MGAADETEAGGGPAPASSTPFVGAQRRRIRDELVGLFGELSRGDRDGLVWVSLEGESGVGKTRIVQEFFEAIAADQTVYPKSLRPPGRESHARKSVAATPEAGGAGLAKGAGRADFAWVGVDCDLHSSTSVGMSGIASANLTLAETFKDEISGSNRPLQAMTDEGLSEAMSALRDHLVGQAGNMVGVAGELFLPFKVATTGVLSVLKRRAARREAEGERFIDPEFAAVDELLGAFADLRGRLLGINRKPVPVVMYIEDLHDGNEAIEELVLFLTALSVARGWKKKFKRVLLKQPALPPVLLLTSAWPSLLNHLAADQAPDQGDSKRGTPMVTVASLLTAATADVEHQLGDDALLIKHALAPLTDEDLEEVAQSYIDQAPGTEADSAGVAIELARHADKNPLLLHLICEDKLDLGMPPSLWLSEDLPPTVRKAFEERWDRLDRDVQGILCLAAHVGREFHAELVTSCAKDLLELIRVKDPQSALRRAGDRAFLRQDQSSEGIQHFFEKVCFDLAIGEARRMNVPARAATALAKNAIAIRDRHRGEWIDEWSWMDKGLYSEPRSAELRPILEAHLRTDPQQPEQLFDAAVSAQLLAALLAGGDPNGEYLASKRYRAFVETHDAQTRGPAAWHAPVETLNDETSSSPGWARDSPGWARNWRGFSPLVWSAMGPWLAERVARLGPQRARHMLLPCSRLMEHSEPLAAARLAEQALSLAEDEKQAREAKRQMRDCLVVVGERARVMELDEQLLETLTGSERAIRICSMTQNLERAGHPDRARELINSELDLEPGEERDTFIRHYAYRLASSGDVDEAIPLLTELYEKDRSSQLGRTLADVLDRAGYPDRALAFNERLMVEADAGERASLRLDRLSLLARAGRLGELIDGAEQELGATRGAERTRALKHVGYAFARAGLRERGIDVLEQLAASAGPEDFRATQRDLATGFLRAARFGRAIAIFSKLAESSSPPELLDAQLALAEALGTAGLHDRAIEATRDLGSLPGAERTSDVASRLSPLLSAAGLHSLARAQAEAALQVAQTPREHHEAVTMLAEVLAAAGLYDEAIERANERLTLVSGDNGLRAIADLTRILSAAGKHAEAVAEAERMYATADDKGRVTATRLLSRVLSNAGQADRAIAVVEELVGKVEPRRRRAAEVMLAETYARNEFYVEALALRESLYASANEVQIRHARKALARAAMNAGQYERAIAVSEEVVASASGDHRNQGLDLMAKVLAAANRHEKAIEVRRERVSSAYPEEQWEVRFRLAQALGAAGLTHESQRAFAELASAADNEIAEKRALEAADGQVV